MKNLIGTENVGYEIIAQGIGAVIGYHARKNEYVAWSYSVENDEPSYFWGHYHSTLKGARESFAEKEGRV